MAKMTLTEAYQRLVNDPDDSEAFIEFCAGGGDLAYGIIGGMRSYDRDELAGEAALIVVECARQLPTDLDSPAAWLRAHITGGLQNFMARMDRAKYIDGKPVSIAASDEYYESDASEILDAHSLLEGDFEKKLWDLKVDGLSEREIASILEESIWTLRRRWAGICTRLLERLDGC